MLLNAAHCLLTGVQQTERIYEKHDKDSFPPDKRNGKNKKDRKRGSAAAEWRKETDLVAVGQRGVKIGLFTADKCKVYLDQGYPQPVQQFTDGEALPNRIVVGRGRRIALQGGRKLDLNVGSHFLKKIK